MCKNLVLKGDLDKPLIIFNRTEKRATDLSNTLPSGKSVVASSVDDAVSKADIIFMCLGDDAAVNGTIDAALKNDVNGKLFVDCSTVHPDTTESLLKRITAAGAEFGMLPILPILGFRLLLYPSISSLYSNSKPAACPVFGAPAMAESGQLVCVLAGPEAAVEKVKPYTTGVMGRANIDLTGQPVSKAALLKVVGNTFIMNMVEALAEGHVLAEKSGLGTENLHKFIELLFPGPYVAYSTRMRSGDYHKREEPLFAVDLARKDVAHALALAKESGMHLKALEVADAHLVQVKEHVGARGDLPAIYGAVRKEGGLKYEN